MGRDVCEVGFRVSGDKQMNPLGWACAGGRRNVRRYSLMPVHWTRFPGIILVSVIQEDPFGIAAASWGLSLCMCDLAKGSHTDVPTTDS